MRHSIFSLALLSLPSSGFAAPAAGSVSPDANLNERQILGGLLGGLSSTVLGLLSSVDNAVKAKNPAAAAQAIVKIPNGNRPTNIADAMARASKVWASPTGRTDIYQAIATQVAVGLGPLLDGTLTAALTGGLPVGENSINNNNPRPNTNIYPQKESSDAPYTLLEDALRKAIYIPPTFTYGTKRPVIMVPGTGSYGGVNFANNLRKLLTGQPFADPVWLNVPDAMLNDTQSNAEYIAYAINYISSVCNDNRNIAVISWSQGGLDTQWVLKYWPSTRAVVQDFLPVSADFKGTIFANALCLSPNSDVGLNPCPPSVIQQEATSGYIAALRRDRGDSAYVPTTSVYSGFFDEIVEPQQGTIASAFLKDERSVGVSNVEVQKICPGQLAGSYYGHAGVLFNPLTYALIVDALTNQGPGSVGRLDLRSVCSSYAAPGLDLDDVLATNALIPVAGVLLLTYPQRLNTEPALRGYAA